MFLYLPIEVAVRELDARLLVAMAAVARGAEVILGQKWLMEANMKAMPAGTWLFKTLTPRDSRWMKRCHDSGNLVCAIDEEVTAFAEGTGDLAWVSPEAIHTVDRLFCQGQGQQESIVARWPELAPRLSITGNPRWDMLGPDLRRVYDAEAEKIRNRHGRIILINTNSGTVNSGKKKSADDVLKSYVKAGKVDLKLESHVRYFNDSVAWETMNYDGIREIVRQLSARHPDHAIVLRPHPAESPVPYEEAFKGLANVKVIFEGQAANWILASEILIHTSCTTGIEAFALGKPSISFEPGNSPMHTIMLSGRIGYRETTVADVLRRAEMLCGSTPAAAAYSNTVWQDYRKFFEVDANLLSSEKIATELATMSGELKSPGDGSAQWRPKWNYARAWRSNSFRERMMPPMDGAAVVQRMTTLADASGGRFAVPAVVEIGRNMFHMFPAGLAPPPPVGSFLDRNIKRLARVVTAR